MLLSKSTILPGLSIAIAGAHASNTTYLTTSALVTNAQNHSAIECWRFDDPVTISETAGTVGAASYTFPDAYETLYAVIPPRSNGGQHNAPVPQYVRPNTEYKEVTNTSLARLVVFLSGVIQVTLPYPASGNTSLDSALLVGGANGLLFAADTTGAGHITMYPSDQSTVSLQIRFKEDQVPSHTTLHQGPCHYKNSAGQTSDLLSD